MEGAGAGSQSGGVVGGAGSVCGEGGDGDAVYEGELFAGLGAEAGREGEEAGLIARKVDLYGTQCVS